MRRFPFLDNGFKWKFDFIWIEWEPAQLCADGLLFQFGTSPNKGRADDADDDREPVVLEEEGSEDDEEAESHHVRPAEIAEDSFAANDEREAESDDEEGEESDEDAEEIHSDQLSVISGSCSVVRLSTCLPVYLFTSYLVHVSTGLLLWRRDIPRGFSRGAGCWGWRGRVRA